MTKSERFKHNLLHFMIALDQLIYNLFGVLFFWCGLKTSADETISARCYRGRANWWWRCLMYFVNFLFWNRNHCKEAYESEKEHKHLDPEYR